MRNPFNRPHPLDPEIDAVVDALQGMSLEDPDYHPTLSTLKRLIELKEQSKSRISPDTLLIVGGNLLGILLILGYEHGHALTSKALGHIVRPKNN